MSRALSSRGRLSTTAGIKLLSPLFRNHDPLERIGALYEVFNLLTLSSPKNCLTVDKLMSEPLAPLWSDPVPLVREAAVSVAESWVNTLMARQAYEEALPLLDALIEYGVGVPGNLQYRTLCHLVLGNERAADVDWRTIELLYEGTDDLVQLGLERGTLAGLRRLVMTLAAEAHLYFSQGEDPCVERRMTKKRLAALRDPSWHRSRARELLDEALAIAEREDEESKEESKYRGRTYGAVAKLLEAEGDLERALKYYRLATEVPTFRRWGWRDDSYDEKARELAEKLSGRVQ